jgi:serine/threonine protein kinase
VIVGNSDRKEFNQFCLLYSLNKDFQSYNISCLGLLQVDGRRIAVKTLNEYIDNRDELFKTEVQTLAKLSHPNVVPLYGCTSLQSRARMLVYQYVGNGTVYDHLHGDEAIHDRLPWNTRMNVAVETASALRYIHCHNIIHGDIETRNILLDADWHIRLGDFGLSRHLPNGHNHVSTGPQGTPGYVDPEFHRRSELTRKSDVFSFGVVMIELISSLRPYDITRPGHYLSDIAMNRLENDALDQLVDHTLGFDANPRVNEMIRGMATLAYRCLHTSKVMRPSMAEVLKTLKGIQSAAGENAI